MSLIRVFRSVVFVCLCLQPVTPTSMVLLGRTRRTRMKKNNKVSLPFKQTHYSTWTLRLQQNDFFFKIFPKYQTNCEQIFINILLHANVLRTSSYDGVFSHSQTVLGNSLLEVAEVVLPLLSSSLILYSRELLLYSIFYSETRYSTRILLKSIKKIPANHFTNQVYIFNIILLICIFYIMLILRALKLEWNKYLFI